MQGRLRRVPLLAGVEASVRQSWDPGLGAEQSESQPLIFGSSCNADSYSLLPAGKFDGELGSNRPRNRGIMIKGKPVPVLVLDCHGARVRRLRGVVTTDPARNGQSPCVV